MRMAVLVKQVPDSDEVRMDPESGTMVRSGVGTLVNPLDLSALAVALRGREREGGTVTAFSMGPPAAEEALREALALGADEAVLLTDRDFAGADTWATARTLSAALVARGPFDLILAGEKATDGETGQVGPGVAAFLGLPFTTYGSALEWIPGGVRVRRTVEEGVEVQELPLPCLVTVLAVCGEPSLPTLAGKKRARRASVVRMGREDLALPREEVGLPGSPTRVVRIATPTLSRSGVRYAGKGLDEGIDDVVRRLRQLALLPSGEPA